MSDSNFLNVEEIVLLSSCLFRAEAFSPKARADPRTWPDLPFFAKGVWNPNICSLLFGVEYYRRIVQRRNAKKNLVAASLLVKTLRGLLECALSKGERPSLRTRKRFSGLIPEPREASLRSLALAVVRGLNQIVDMNQTAKFALSFKFILRKIYFDADVIDFVAEMRHAVVHKAFPSARNVLRLAKVVFWWSFRHFWLPLLSNNLHKFSPRRLQLLSPFFARGVSLTQEPLLRAFDPHRLDPPGARGFDPEVVALFRADERFFGSEAFQANLARLLKIRGRLNLAKRRKKQKAQRLFEIKEMEEEVPGAKPKALFENLRLCLDPSRTRLQR